MENTKKTGEFVLHEKNTRAILGATYLRVSSEEYVRSYGKAFGCVVDVAPQKPVCVVWMEHRGAGINRGHSIEFEPAQSIQPQTEAFTFDCKEWSLRLHRANQQPEGYALELWRQGNLLAVVEWWNAERAVTAYAEGDITAFEAFAKVVLEG